jgi:hypothetical protein
MKKIFYDIRIVRRTHKLERLIEMYLNETRNKAIVW